MHRLKRKINISTYMCYSLELLFVNKSMFVEYCINYFRLKVYQILPMMF